MLLAHWMLGVHKVGQTEGCPSVPIQHPRRTLHCI